MQYDIDRTQFDMDVLRRQMSGSSVIGSVGSETPDRLPGRAINNMKEQLVLEGKIMKGRQTRLEVHKHFGISEKEGMVLDPCGLTQVKSFNDQFAAVLNDWDYALGARELLPSDNILELSFYHQAHRSQFFATR